MAVKAEYLAVQKLRELLLLALPARVATINLTRAAVLRTPWAGPFVIPALAVLKVSTTQIGAATTSISIASGDKTTAQLVTIINAVVPGLASVDDLDRLVLTSPTAPTAGTASIMSVAADTTGVNAILGWSTSGDHDLRTALAAPGPKSVMDGEPLIPDADLFPEGGVVVLFDERRSTPRSQNVRDDTYVVDLDLVIFRIEPQQATHRNREPIHAALQAVRECILTDAGRYASAPPNTSTAILKVIERSARIGASPIPLAKGLNALADIAELKLSVLVFERPDAT